MGNNDDILNDDDLLGPGVESSEDTEEFNDEIDLNLEQSNEEIDAINKSASKPFYKTAMGIISISVVSVALLGSFAMGYFNDSKKPPVRTAKTTVQKQVPDNKLQQSAAKKTNTEQQYELVSSKSKPVNDNLGSPKKSTTQQQPPAELTSSKAARVTSSQSSQANKYDEEKEALKAEIATKNALLSKKSSQVRRLESQLKKAQETIKSKAGKVRNGLTRIAGFKVITSSSDSKYAIVQAPNRTITLFKGESFYSHLGSHTVTAFDAKQKKLTVDDKYYIDEKLVPRPIKTHLSKQTVMDNEIAANKRKQNIKKRTSFSRSPAYGKEKITDYKVLSFSRENKVAVVKDKKNVIHRVLIDQVFKGYGHLLNITENGDLVFNDYIIQHTNNF